MSKPSVYVTIQARMTSTRLPGKVIMPAVNKPLLSLMVERLRRIKNTDGIILCTTTNDTDDPLKELADELGIHCYRGSEDNVMSRVLEGAQEFNADIIVETTGDCPLIDPDICTQVIDHYFETDADYTSNIYKRCYPIGMDTQIFSTKVLADAYARTQDDEEREHVSLHIYRHPERYKLTWIEAPDDQVDPHLRLTLDTPEDYQVIVKVFEELYPQKPDFTLDDILQYLKDNPDVRAINNTIEHNWVQY